MKRSVLTRFLLVASIIFLIGCQNETTAPGVAGTEMATVKQLTVADASSILDLQNALFVDVRQPAELASDGAYPGATNIPLNELSASSLPADKSTPLVFACRSGNRSSRAAAQAIGLGYTKVYNLVGGINAWKAASMPTQ